MINRNQFLLDSLATLRFPERVGEDVVTAYGHLCPLVVSRNKHLGFALRRLVASTTDPMVLMQVACASLIGLDAVLALPEIPSPVLEDVLTAWHLSPADQLHALDRPLADETLDYLSMFDVYLGTEAIELVARRHEVIVTMSPEREKVYGWDVPVSVLKEEEYPSWVPAEYISRGLWLTMDAFENFYDLSFLSDALTEHLGEGNTEDSLSAWRNYLGLLDSPPRVLLCDLVDASRRLVAA